MENQSYYTVIVFLIISAMLIMQLFVSHNNTFLPAHKTLFRTLFAVIAAAALCEWLGASLQGAPRYTRAAHIVIKTCELSIAPSIGFLFAWIIDNRHRKIIWTFLAIHALAECLSGIFGFIYVVDENNIYSHAQGYWIYIACYILSALYCIAVVFRNVKKYQYRGGLVFLLIVLWMMAGIVVQLVNSSLKVDYVSVGMAAILVYVFTLEMIQQTDALTQLINRRGYENSIFHIEEKSIIIFFDVDSFKQVNDRYGHAFGDVVLRHFGQSIKRVYAPYGRCFRYGGDEFCVILTKNLDHVEELNDRFIQELAQLREQEPRLPGVSVGYARFTPGNDSIRDVIRQADEMMYRSKQQ